MWNKLEHNFQISNKKALFHNLKSYLGDEVYEIVPRTFHVVDGVED